MRVPTMVGRLVVACVLSAPGVASAAPFTNGGFELGVAPGATFINLGAGSTGIAGWLVSAGNIDYIGGLWQPSEGSRSVDMNGSAPGALSQTFDTNPGSQYEVKFSLAGNVAGPPTIKSLRVSAAGAQGDFAFDVTGRNYSNMGWAEQLFVFTATGAATTLEFRSLSTEACCYGPAIDNVRVSEVNLNPVPEPATFGLLALGLALGLRRRL